MARAGIGACASACLLLSTAGPVAADDVEPTPTPTPTAATATPTAMATPTADAGPVVAAVPAATATPASLPEPEATPAAAPPPEPGPAAVVAPPPPVVVAPVPTATVSTPAPAPAPSPVRAAPAARPRQVSARSAAPRPAPPSDCASPGEDGSACAAPSSVCGVVGTDGPDVLQGTSAADVLCGFGGDDQIFGFGGDDVLVGGTGDDVLDGGDGKDCLLGGPGDDEAADGDPADVLGVERPEPVAGAPVAVGVDGSGRCLATGVRDDRPPPVTPPIRPPSPALVPTPGAAPPVPLGPSHPTFVSGAGPIVDRRPAAQPGPGLPSVPPITVRDLDIPSQGRLPWRLRGRGTVRRGAVRLQITCDTTLRGELFVLVGTRRVGHRRFTCRPSHRRVTVRLTAAGRRLVGRDRLRRARVLVLLGGRTGTRRVVLVRR